MFSAIKRWFTPPVFDGDEEKTRLASLLNTIIIIAITLIILISIGDVLGGKTPASTWIINWVMVAFCLVLRRWLFHGKIRLVGVVLVGLGFFFLTASNITLGTVRTPTAAMYLFLVITAGWVFGLNGVLATTLISSLLILGLIVAENAGELPRPDYTVTITQWITYTGLFGLVGSMTYIAHQIMHQALERSRKDLVERKHIEEDLRTSEARFRSLFEQTHDAIFILDLTGKHLAVNQRATQMLGYTAQEFLKLTTSDITAEKAQSKEILHRLLAGEHIPHYERFFRKKNGQRFPVEINVELVRDGNGNPQHIQSVVRDISQRKETENALRTANEQLSLQVAEVGRLQAELQEQALRDPLTGLYNRRYLSETLEREVARAWRENGHLSIVVSDIDHFKDINDTHGHQVGDRFLVEIASLLKRLTRPTDIVCRYGGEEFLLILPGANTASARQRAEEIRHRCAEIIIHHEGIDLSVSISLGVATYPDHGDTADEIIIKADKALYYSKAAGRNCVTEWSEALQESPAEKIVS